MKILFLTNNENSLILADWLRNSAKEEVHVVSDRINKEKIFEKKYDFLISYNYKYIIKKEILDYFPRRAINLHISYLPWNKGSNPNFWSFVENSIKGVTIHLLNEGLDTGDILLQEEVKFNENNETLKSSYEKLQSLIQELFCMYWEDIKNIRIIPMPQKVMGSYHTLKEFEKYKSFLGEDIWSMKISYLKIKLKEIGA
ncbi:MAG: formyl transferase [Ignavibacteria bacterium]|jgi:methionyl-tRNA formyltransferase|nr:formyl transferase [Ignavibacteria bacterium]MCU7503725.1 formyl transferase [Ignavibacteria bacterium]MCU7517629.1 formyl transferase [Ignavibacteria bacterium]